ncbi:MAG: hypothetical protein QW491_12710 [Thermoproteota archaeon]
MVLNQCPEAFSCLTVFEIILLCQAAFQDLKKRELDASAWLPILLLGLSAFILQLASNMLLETFFKLVQTMSLLGLLLFIGLYGPGDALILVSICLTHVSTTRPLLHGGLLRFFHPDFSLTVLLNAEILSSTSVASNLFHNLRSGAWSSSPSEPFKKRFTSMLLFRAVRKGDESSPNGLDIGGAAGRIVFVKKTVPLAFFILIGYVVTLLFGSLLPLPV